MYEYRCNVVRVVDGDTLVLDIDLGFHIHVQEYLRLAGVDAPEIFGSRATPAGKVFKAFVEAWVAANGPVFWLSSHKYDQREKYGRVLGDLWPETSPELLPLPPSLAMAVQAELDKEPA